MTEENIFFQRKYDIKEDLLFYSCRNDNFSKIEVGLFPSWHFFINDNTMQWSGGEHLGNLLYGDRATWGAWVFTDVNLTAYETQQILFFSSCYS